jgi:DNA-binding response OmpR family regulator
MGHTILIADDEPKIRESLEHYALLRGHRTILASNGPEVLSKVNEERPDVIVLDVMMPGMEGTAVLHQLQQSDLRDVPVVMLSAVSGIFTPERCLQLGAAAYFEKPCPLEDLFERVEQLAASGRERRASKDDAPKGCLTLLIADDDRSIRSMFKEMAQKSGHRVLEAANGVEALSCLAETKPDAMVLDVMMPKMDGPEVLVRMREKGYGGVPVVVLSAVGGPFTRERCLQLGAADYFTKPFRLGELLAKLEALATRSQGQPATVQVGSKSRSR